MSNAYDCWLTPPCAARAIGAWLNSRVVDELPRLDPFAGPGTLLRWSLADDMDRVYDVAFELDARWGSELLRNVHALNYRLGRDSFALDWETRCERPHVITNPPYSQTLEAVERARDHAYSHERWAAVLMRTDWWQHPNRGHLAPDHFLALQWRPVFGMSKHGKFGTDYAGYSWCVWAPTPTGECRMEWLARPEVPRELVAEHRRLARIAHQMGLEAQGAT